MNPGPPRETSAPLDGDRLARLLARVHRPARYLGVEPNVTVKDWATARARIVLAFPDLYEIGMSHRGLAILYHRVNRDPAFLAERVYTPDRDLEEELRSQGLPLFSLESRRPLAAFDLLGITLPYELAATNILTILDLAGLPFYARERRQGMPLVIGGGPGAFQPEPVAPFFDAILLGDGEEAILEIMAAVAAAKEAGKDRDATLAAIGDIQGVYLPAAGEGANRPRVRRRVLPELDPEPLPPLVPLARVVHDRVGVEVARGCTRGCRFCQAGIIYRPVRERRPQEVVREALEGVAAGGFDELALLSLSTGDYSCLAPVLSRLMASCAPQRVSVSLPSMRVGTLTGEVMAEIQKVRKTGFTLAPEAGSDRLRRVINKGITEADLLETCRQAVRLGWRRIKLYFMFGLPGETEEDIDAIVGLARRIHKETGVTVTVSAATFVPKAHTPFQWERQLGVEEGRAIIQRLRAGLRGRAYTLRYHDPRMSFLEGVLSRGGRELAPVIVSAWQRGARLDAWSDHFRLEHWQEAAAACGVDMAGYLRRRAMDEPLPWDHLDPGVERDFLVAEYEKALREEYTPDCRTNGCRQCGLCDFKEVRPRTWAGAEVPPVEPVPVRYGTTTVARYRLDYTKHRPMHLLGHLETIGLFYRALRRARLPLAYSQGHNPSPKVTFGPALALGVESDAEYLVVECTTVVADPGGVVAACNGFLPDGLTVTAMVPVGAPPPAQLVSYRLTPGDSFDEQRLASFLAATAWPHQVRRKKKGRTVTREIDLRSLVTTAVRTADGFCLTLIVEPSRAGLPVTELVRAVFGLDDQAMAALAVRKTAWQPLDEKRLSLGHRAE